MAPPGEQKVDRVMVDDATVKKSLWINGSLAAAIIVAVAWAISTFKDIEAIALASNETLKGLRSDVKAVESRVGAVAESTSGMKAVLEANLRRLERHEQVDRELWAAIRELEKRLPR